MDIHIGTNNTALSDAEGCKNFDTDNHGKVALCQK